MKIFYISKLGEKPREQFRGLRVLKITPYHFFKILGRRVSFRLNNLWRCIMFYPVRVLDSKNHLKQIISVKELRVKHWSEYEKKQEAYASTRIKKNINSLIIKQ